MRKITITQMNVDGKGNNRVLMQWVKAARVEMKLRQISRAYNMDHTTVEVS